MTSPIGTSDPAQEAHRRKPNAYGRREVENRTLDTAVRFLVYGFLIFVLSGALFPRLFAGTVYFRNVSHERYLALNLFHVGVYAAFVPLVVARGRTVLRTLTRVPLLGLLLAMILLSTAWSADPVRTVLQALLVVFVVLLGICVARDLSLQEFVRLLGVICAFMLFLSITLIACCPSYGVMQVIHPGVPQGAFYHKNGLGRVMAFSFVVFLTLFSERKRWSTLLLMIGSLGLMLASQSATALIATVGVVAAYVALVTVKDERLLIGMATVGAMVMAIASPWIGQALDYTLQLLGRSPTFTGRTTLWLFGLEFLRERPVLGYGLGAFWSVHGDEVRSLAGWDMGHLHNSWLDLALQIGLVGAGLTALLYLWLLVRSLRYARVMNQGSARFPFLFLIFLGISSGGSSIVLVRHSMTDLILAAIIFFVVFQPREPYMDELAGGTAAPHLRRAHHSCEGAPSPGNGTSLD